VPLANATEIKAVACVNLTGKRIKEKDTQVSDSPKIEKLYTKIDN